MDPKKGTQSSAALQAKIRAAKAKLTCNNRKRSPLNFREVEAEVYGLDDTEPFKLKDSPDKDHRIRIAKEKFRVQWKMGMLDAKNNIIMPTDGSTLKLLYGTEKGRANSSHPNFPTEKPKLNSSNVFSQSSWRPSNNKKYNASSLFEEEEGGFENTGTLEQKKKEYSEKIFGQKRESVLIQLKEQITGNKEKHVRAPHTQSKIAKDRLYSIDAQTETHPDYFDIPEGPNIHYNPPEPNPIISSSISKYSPDSYKEANIETQPYQKEFSNIFVGSIGKSQNLAPAQRSFSPRGLDVAWNESLQDDTKKPISPIFKDNTAKLFGVPEVVRTTEDIHCEQPKSAVIPGLTDYSKQKIGFDSEINPIERKGRIASPRTFLNAINPPTESVDPLSRERKGANSIRNQEIGTREEGPTLIKNADEPRELYGKQKSLESKPVAGVQSVRAADWDKKYQPVFKNLAESSSKFDNYDVGFSEGRDEPCLEHIASTHRAPDNTYPNQPLSNPDEVRPEISERPKSFLSGNIERPTSANAVPNEQSSGKPSVSSPKTQIPYSPPLPLEETQGEAPLRRELSPQSQSRRSPLQQKIIESKARLAEIMQQKSPTGHSSPVLTNPIEENKMKDNKTLIPSEKSTLLGDKDESSRRSKIQEEEQRPYFTENKPNTYPDNISKPTQVQQYSSISEKPVTQPDSLRDSKFYPTVPEEKKYESIKTLSDAIRPSESPQEDRMKPLYSQEGKAEKIHREVSPRSQYQRSDHPQTVPVKSPNNKDSIPQFPPLQLASSRAQPEYFIEKQEKFASPREKGSISPYKSSQPLFSQYPETKMTPTKYETRDPNDNEVHNKYEEQLIPVHGEIQKYHEEKKETADDKVSHSYDEKVSSSYKGQADYEQETIPHYYEEKQINEYDSHKQEGKEEIEHTDKAAPIPEDMRPINNIRTSPIHEKSPYNREGKIDNEYEEQVFMEHEKSLSNQEEKMDGEKRDKHTFLHENIRQISEIRASPTHGKSSHDQQEKVETEYQVPFVYDTEKVIDIEHGEQAAPTHEGTRYHPDEKASPVREKSPYHEEKKLDKEYEKPVSLIQQKSPHNQDKKVDIEYIKQTVPSPKDIQHTQEIKASPTHGKSPYHEGGNNEHEERILPTYEKTPHQEGKVDIEHIQQTVPSPKNIQHTQQIRASPTHGKSPYHEGENNEHEERILPTYEKIPHQEGKVDIEYEKSVFPTNEKMLSHKEEKLAIEYREKIAPPPEDIQHIQGKRVSPAHGKTPSNQDKKIDTEYIEQFSPTYEKSRHYQEAKVDTEYDKTVLQSHEENKYYRDDQISPSREDIQHIQGKRVSPAHGKTPSNQDKKIDTEYIEQFSPTYEKSRHYQEAKVDTEYDKTVPQPHEEKKYYRDEIIAPSREDIQHIQDKRVSPAHGKTPSNQDKKIDTEYIEQFPSTYEKSPHYQETKTDTEYEKSLLKTHEKSPRYQETKMDTEYQGQVLPESEDIIKIREKRASPIHEKSPHNQEERYIVSQGSKSPSKTQQIPEEKFDTTLHKTLSKEIKQDEDNKSHVSSKTSKSPKEKSIIFPNPDALSNKDETIISKQPSQIEQTIPQYQVKESSPSLEQKTFHSPKEKSASPITRYPEYALSSHSTAQHPSEQPTLKAIDPTNISKTRIESPTQIAEKSTSPQHLVDSSNQETSKRENSEELIEKPNIDIKQKIESPVAHPVSPIQKNNLSVLSESGTKPKPNFQIPNEQIRDSEFSPTTKNPTPKIAPALTQNYPEQKFDKVRGESVLQTPSPITAVKSQDIPTQEVQEIEFRRAQREEEEKFSTRILKQKIDSQNQNPPQDASHENVSQDNLKSNEQGIAKIVNFVKNTMMESFEKSFDVPSKQTNPEEKKLISYENHELSPIQYAQESQTEDIYKSNKIISRQLFFYKISGVCKAKLKEPLQELIRFQYSLKEANYKLNSLTNLVSKKMNEHFSGFLFNSLPTVTKEEALSKALVGIEKKQNMKRLMIGLYKLQHSCDMEKKDQKSSLELKRMKALSLVSSLLCVKLRNLITPLINIYKEIEIEKIESESQILINEKAARKKYSPKESGILILKSIVSRKIIPPIHSLLKAPEAKSKFREDNHKSGMITLKTLLLHKLNQRFLPLSQGLQAKQHNRNFGSILFHAFIQKTLRRHYTQMSYFTAPKDKSFIFLLKSIILKQIKENFQILTEPEPEIDSSKLKIFSTILQNKIRSQFEIMKENIIKKLQKKTNQETASNKFKLVLLTHLVKHLHDLNQESHSLQYNKIEQKNKANIAADILHKICTKKFTSNLQELVHSAYNKRMNTAQFDSGTLTLKGIMQRKLLNILYVLNGVSKDNTIKSVLKQASKDSGTQIFKSILQKKFYQHFSGLMEKATQKEKSFALMRLLAMNKKISNTKMKNILQVHVQNSFHNFLSMIENLVNTKQCSVLKKNVKSADMERGTVLIKNLCLLNLKQQFIEIQKFAMFDPHKKQKKATEKIFKIMTNAISRSINQTLLHINTSLKNREQRKVLLKQCVIYKEFRLMKPYLQRWIARLKLYKNRLMKVASGTSLFRRAYTKINKKTKIVTLAKLKAFVLFKKQVISRMTRACHILSRLLNQKRKAKNAFRKWRKLRQQRVASMLKHLSKMIKKQEILQTCIHSTK